jgi:LmbE family N-acetylglucosaminyl deacetylase
VLGVQDILFYDQPDAAEEIDAQTVKRKLIELLAQLQPAEVYTLDEEADRHPAHRLAGKLARESILESGIVPPAGLWACQVWGAVGGVGTD